MYLKQGRQQTKPREKATRKKQCINPVVTYYQPLCISVQHTIEVKHTDRSATHTGAVYYGQIDDVGYQLVVLSECNTTANEDSERQLTSVH